MRLLRGGLLFAAAVGVSLAQTGVSAFDGLTPQGLEPGSPAGSHALSGLDTVNLYNGRMNLAVPLFRVGGRGEAGYTVSVQYSGEWDGEGYFTTPTTWGFSMQGWADWDYRYRPAGINLRQTSQGVTNPQPGGCGAYLYSGTLTRLTVGFADGTEMELRDAGTGGAIENPNNTNCTAPYFGAFDRGRTWVSVDGSATTFIADNDVYDQYYNEPYSLSGTLYFRDGRIYHFSYIQVDYISGRMATTVDWIQDRNGNKITFTYGQPDVSGAQLGFTIVDPLNRQTRVDIGIPYMYSDCGCNGSYDQISTATGSGGAVRTYYIYWRSYWYDRLASLQNSSWPSYYTLFGGFASASSMPYDYGVSKIALPDGSSYIFHYDQYGEIGRVDLPNGVGAYEFDWTFGPANGTGGSQAACTNEGIGSTYNVVVAPYDQTRNTACQLIAVYRRLSERREYANGGTGSSWTRKTDYTPTELAAGTAVAGDPLSACAGGFYCSQVSVTETDPTQGTLASEVHYFYGAPSQGLFGASLQGPLPLPGWYSWAFEGLEFRTDRSAPTWTTLQTWQQRAIPSWWTSSQGPQPAVDSRVTQANTTIENQKMSQRSMSYDSFNNRTDLYEYGYGNTSGSLGPLIRHTHTDYLTTYNNLNNSPPVYLLSLPSDQIVYDANNNTASLTNY